MKFVCGDTFYNLPAEAAERIIHPCADCDFCCEAGDRRELIKLIVEHATEVHGLEDRRLAPPVFMERVEAHITED